MKPKSRTVEVAVIRVGEKPAKQSVEVEPHKLLEKVCELSGIPYGYAEAISLYDGRVMLVDEDAPFKSLPVNVFASEIATRAGVRTAHGVILGNVAICWEKDFH